MPVKLKLNDFSARSFSFPFLLFKAFEIQLQRTVQLLMSRNQCLKPTRVTRLDEFSPSGRFFSFGGFMKSTAVPENFGLLFSKVKVIYYFWQKWVWLRFGQISHKLIWSL
jgi:hypothetical protein